MGRRNRSPWGLTHLILGSADRFRSWRDFAVRLRGAGATRQLAAALAGGCSPLLGAAPLEQAHMHEAASPLAFAVNAPAAFCPFAFALRAQLPGRFDVRAALRGFFGDASLHRYTVAAAYLDASGAAFLDGALARGAHVTLVMPAVPNVYQHANAAALCSLLRAPPAPGRGRLCVALHGAMVHAKAAVGFRTDGSAVALIGSANLKQRSLTQFGELLLRVEGGAFTARLAAALVRLASEATVVDAADARESGPAWGFAPVPVGAAQQQQPRAARAARTAAVLRYVPIVAALEEWFG